MNDFEEWLKLVDREVTRITTIGVHDLEDCLLRDWYEDEIDPVEAAHMALDNDTLYGHVWRDMA